MPSFHEQCSYVAIEMMMYGIPLIGTDSTGLKEMLGDNQKYMMKIFEEANNVSLSVENLAHTLVPLCPNHCIFAIPIRFRILLMVPWRVWNTALKISPTTRQEKMDD